MSDQQTGPGPDLSSGTAAPWTSPSAGTAQVAGPAATSSWQPGVPLGGVAPPPAAPVGRSGTRDLLLTAILLVAALAAGATSLLAWRDVGRLARGTESGWQEFDGGLGRGWIAVLGGVLLAVAGVLVAAEKGRSGRTLATLTGIGLMVFAVLEWALGLRNVRSGPGPGLWLLFVVGMLVVIAVGVLAPEPEPEPDAPSTS